MSATGAGCLWEYMEINTELEFKQGFVKAAVHRAVCLRVFAHRPSTVFFADMLLKVDSNNCYLLLKGANF